MRRRQAEPTRMTDVQQMNEIPCCIFEENLAVVCPRNRYSAFFWSTLARFRVASNIQIQYRLYNAMYSLLEFKLET